MYDSGKQRTRITRHAGGTHEDMGREMMTSTRSEPSAARLPAVNQLNKRSGAAIGAALGGIAGLAVARIASARLPMYVVFGVGGAAAGAMLGHLVAKDGGSSVPTPDPDRNVGVAYGRRMVDRPDGTSEWAETTVPLLLGKQIGAMAGYATLATALAETRPNSGTGEIAYMRRDDRIHAFQLAAPGLEVVQGFRATAPDVVAYTTRESGRIHAGPAATTEEREINILVDPLPDPF